LKFISASVCLIESLDSSVKVIIEVDESGGLTDAILFERIADVTLAVVAGCSFCVGELVVASIFCDFVFCGEAEWDASSIVRLEAGEEMVLEG